MKRKVLYKFDAVEKSHLSVRVNDVVSVIDDSRGDGWCLVQDENKNAGLVPKSYMKAETRKIKKMRKCKVCNETILGVTREIGDDIFHEHCFFCKQCQDVIEEEEPFQMIRGRPYHEECARDVKFCAACEQLMIGRGKAAFEVVYHRKCYVCSICGTGTVHPESSLEILQCVACAQKVEEDAEKIEVKNTIVSSAVEQCSLKDVSAQRSTAKLDMMKTEQDKVEKKEIGEKLSDMHLHVPPAKPFNTMHTTPRKSNDLVPTSSDSPVMIKEVQKPKASTSPVRKNRQDTTVLTSAYIDETCSDVDDSSEDLEVYPVANEICLGKPPIHQPYNRLSPRRQSSPSSAVQCNLSSPRRQSNPSSTVPYNLSSPKRKPCSPPPIEQYNSSSPKSQPNNSPSAAPYNHSSPKRQQNVSLPGELCHPSSPKQQSYNSTSPKRQAHHSSTFADSSSVARTENLSQTTTSNVSQYQGTNVPTASVARSPRNDQELKSSGHEYTAPADNVSSIGYCAACTANIIGEAIEIHGQYFHEQCFICTFCSLPIDEAGYVPFENESYHTACYQKKFGKRCKQCGQVLTGSILHALEQYFHPECFLCGHCGIALRDTFFEEKGHPVCEGCMAQKPSDRVLPTATAACPYVAKNNTQLSLKMGETVKVINKCEDGFWLVTINGKNGHVPGDILIEQPSPIATPKVAGMCSKCSFQNPNVARFCSQCGNSL